MESKENPWQDPPLMLAEEILNRLPLSDHIRFAVVCRQWRYLQRQLRLYHKPLPPPMLRLPWLIPSVRGGLSLTAALSPLEPKPQLYPFHSATTATPLETLLGVSHGWLILFYVRIRLVNPISGDEIQIPSPYLKADPSSGLLSGPPSHRDGFTIMVRSSTRSLLWWPGQSNWTVLTMLPNFTENRFNKSIRSVVSCGGKFYMESFNGKFFLVDPRRPVPAVEDLDCAVMPQDRHWADFLVDLDGQLLLVRAAVERKRKAKVVCCVGGFEVFRAEKTWVRMKGLGDRALFISENCSFSLVADAAGGIRDNHIYFPESILEALSSEELPLWKGCDLGTGTMIEGSPFPAVTDRYDWAQFRSGLQWMMPEPVVIAEPGEKKKLVRRRDVRNIAIVAHVDHGKTTLVDSMLRQAKVFRDNQVVQERERERERGITILGKNASITYKGTKINIIDTPYFGVEVERVLNMVEGVLLVVDSEEGPMPQTRFVLKRTLEFGHEIVLVVNNVDKPSAQPNSVISGIFDLLDKFNATAEQSAIQVISASGINGKAGLHSKSSDNLADDLGPLFEAILRWIPEPNIDKNGALQMLVTSTEYDEHKGRIAIGRLHAGILQRGMEVKVCTSEDTCRFGKIDELFVYESFSLVPAESVEAGDICAVCGISDIMTGETIADKSTGKPLPAIKVGEPTVKMSFSIKTAPFVGRREGNCVTSINLRDRLYRELVRNLAIKVENGETAGTFFVSGRGTLPITILIENMRMEGYEFMVGPPKVITRMDEKLLEPFETATVEVPEEYVRPVVELMEKRCGQRIDMQAMGSKGKTFIKYEIPTRGLLGLRNAILTASQGTAILNTLFDGYGPWAGDISTRDQGSLVSLENGTATSYALFSAQERGQMFISPGMEVYKGQIVGIHQLPGDLSLNVCKEEAATNVRSNKEATVVPDSPLTYSLDDCIEYIQDDELVVVTPLSIRMCKNPKSAK